MPEGAKADHSCEQHRNGNPERVATTCDKGISVALGQRDRHVAIVGLAA